MGLTKKFLGFTLNFVLWGFIYAVGAAMFVCMARLLKGRALKAADAVGKVSALIFVLHPLTRFLTNTIVVSFIPDCYNTMVIIYVILTALAVWIYRKLKIDATVNRLIAGKS